MTLLASLPRIEEHRVSVVFDCPHCRTAAVRGTAYDLRETIRFTERVPVWGWSSHWVRCSHCHCELVADCESKEFTGASAATVAKHVHAYQPLTQRVLAVAGLAVGWVPVIGVLVALLATAANARTRGWPLPTSIVALVLTAAFNLALFGTMIYWSVMIARPFPA